MTLINISQYTAVFEYIFPKYSLTSMQALNSSASSIIHNNSLRLAQFLLKLDNGLFSRMNLIRGKHWSEHLSYA